MSEGTPELQYAQSDTPQPWTVGVGFIALRLLGVYQIVQAIILLSTLTRFAMGMVPRGAFYDEDIVASIMISVLPGVAGLLLIVFAKGLSAALFSLPGIAPARVEADQVIRLGTVLLGLWLAMSALPQLVRTIIDIIEAVRQNMDSSVVQSPGWIVFHTDLLTYLLPLVLGVFLFARPGWVVGQFRKRSRV